VGRGRGGGRGEQSMSRSRYGWRWAFDKQHSEAVYSVLLGDIPPSQYFAWMYFHNPLFVQMNMPELLKEFDAERGKINEANR
jgi:hypothetical protein